MPETFYEYLAIRDDKVVATIHVPVLRQHPAREAKKLRNERYPGCILAVVLDEESVDAQS